MYKDDTCQQLGNTAMYKDDNCQQLINTDMYEQKRRRYPTLRNTVMYKDEKGYVYMDMFIGLSGYFPIFVFHDILRARIDIHLL